MAPPRTTSSELQRYLQEWLDTKFQEGLLNRNRRAATLRIMRRHIPAAVASLNKTGRARIGSSMTIFLRDGRDPDNGRFNLFEIQLARKVRPRPLKCFVGHRFTPAISKSLRSNLRHVLEPSRIRLIWSGMDLRATGFFDDLLRQIRRCDFCIFDNRQAVSRPNVYIEAGIAYALKKPFILADYQGNRTGIPSDLKHILSIPYRDYSQLCKRIYFSLPIFLSATGLLRRR